MVLPLLAALALAAATSPAGACPAPPPGDPMNSRCTKYQRMISPEPVVPLPARFVRARPLVLPRQPTPAAAMRALVGASWVAIGVGGPQRLRLFDASDVPALVPTGDGNRLVRELTWVAGRYRITLDGGTYQLERCRDARRRPSTCLVAVAGPAVVAPPPGVGDPAVAPTP